MYLMVALKNRINVRKDTSIITSGIASLYCMYLQWSALSADVDGTCNLVKGKATNDTLQIVSGICFTVVCLFIISASKPRSEMTKEEQNKADAAAVSTTDPLGQPKTDEEGKPLTDNRTEQEAMADANAAVYGKKIQKNTIDDDDDDLADHKKGEKDGHIFPISDVSIQFQLLMVLSALYYSMLLTNWMNPS